jgi:hypothetical protein
MALNTWHVALSDPNDPDSDRTVVMSDDEVRDAYPQFAGRAAQFVDRDGIRVSVNEPSALERWNARPNPELDAPWIRS